MIIHILKAIKNYFKNNKNILTLMKAIHLSSKVIINLTQIKIVCTHDMRLIHWLCKISYSRNNINKNYYLKLNIFQKINNIKVMTYIIPLICSQIKIRNLFIMKIFNNKIIIIF
jgi:hypothetical protein